jgi:hypothetical protein
MCIIKLKISSSLKLISQLFFKLKK